MALIKCPECGNPVSSFAKSCPSCGYPIEKMNPSGPVRIKIARGVAGTVTVLNMGTNETLWTGRAGQIAEFNVEQETPIGIIWGAGKKPMENCTATVIAGDRYALEFAQGFFTGGYVLNKVDVIDSE